MIFSSFAFLLYFLPAALLGYFLLSFSVTVQNLWLLIASLVFYAWGEPVCALLLCGSMVMNYLFGLMLGSRKGAKPVLWLAVGCNLAILAVFKCADFLYETVNSLLHTSFSAPAGLILPIGLSFYTLRALSYLFDVSRKKAPAQKNPISLGLYLAFFPTLLAGPVASYHGFEKQLTARKVGIDRFSDGVVRFVIGLAKKVLLADQLAALTDTIFALTLTGSVKYQVPVAMAWLGIFCFALQIFLDLSGYADMAIGLGLFFGFRLPENFDFPYSSLSITEFWKKWHTTLTGWFREYVYHPLNGDKAENQDKLVRNMFIMWILIGAWHGITWTYLIWGAYNCFFMLLERILRLEKKEGNVLLRRCATLVIVGFGWLIFRCESLGMLNSYMTNLIGGNMNPLWAPEVWAMIREYWLVILLCLVCSSPVPARMIAKMDESFGEDTKFYYQLIFVLLMCLMAALSVVYLVMGGSHPFFYFRF